MIKEDASVPRSAELLELLNQKNYLKLVRDWQDVVFHTVFVKKREGLELPMLLEVHGNQTFLGSPDPEGARAALASFETPEGADVFIKPVPLKELARNAFMLGAWLTWLGEEIILNSSLMNFLGMKAIGRHRRGGECLYESTALSLQQSGTDGSEVMKAQKWHVTPMADGAVCGEADIAIVYDDSRGLLLAADGALFDESTPRSRLAPGEQALFDWWSQPAYDFAALADAPDAPAGPETEDTYQPHSSLIRDELLESFFDLERAVNNQLMPASDRLMLEVVEGTVISEQDAAGDGDFLRVKSLQYQIRFKEHEDWLLLLGGDGVALEDFSDQIELPRQTGLHPVPENLRTRLVRSVAWVLFWRGRDPGKPIYLVPGQFFAAKPFHPDNLKRLFIPDYDDRQYPVLASMECGTDKLPVLIHGEVAEGYMCEPLEDRKIPAQDLPRGILDRDSLLVNGVLPLGTMCSSLVVPVAAIEFPDEWYQGLRTSNTQLISDVQRFLRERAADSNTRNAQNQISYPADIGKVLMAGLAFVAIIAVLIVIIG